MKTYRIERLRGDRWLPLFSGTVAAPIESPNIHYVCGFQDAIHWCHPHWAGKTRIVASKDGWENVVRTCENWSPTPAEEFDLAENWEILSFDEKERDSSRSATGQHD